MRTFRPTRSSGGEFFSIRDYAKGDNPRAIAWRATARRGHLVVRENADREHRRLQLEVEPGLLAGEALERFVSAVAGLVVGELGNDVALAMRCGDTVVGSGTGPRQRGRIFDALARVPVRASSADKESSRQVAQLGVHGRVTVRSNDGGEAKVFGSQDLVNACADWSGLPVPESHPQERRISSAISALARRVRRLLLPTKGGRP